MESHKSPGFQTTNQITWVSNVNGKISQTLGIIHCPPSSGIQSIPSSKPLAHSSKIIYFCSQEKWLKKHEVPQKKMQLIQLQVYLPIQNQTSYLGFVNWGLFTVGVFDDMYIYIYTIIYTYIQLGKPQLARVIKPTETY